MTKNLLDMILGSNPNTMFVVPAYGRKLSMADWDAGKDFRMLLSDGFGPYLSNRDLNAMRANGINLLYFVDPETCKIAFQENFSGIHVYRTIIK